MIESYPLSWPDGWKRTSATHRSVKNTWKAGFGRYLKDLLDELRKLGAQSVIVSSNLRLRRDGMPAADQREPNDAGIAVYFTFKKLQMCFACDRYTQTRWNLHAIGLTINAIRTIERNGASDMMERAFRGFTALPAKASDSWRDVLGFPHGAPVSKDSLDSRFRELAKAHHPDTGGERADPDQLRRILQARDEARIELTA